MLIHAQGHRKRLKSTAVKGVNAPCFCSAQSSRARIPFVFRDNLLRISQIARLSPLLPSFHHLHTGQGKLVTSGKAGGELWGCCPQSGCTLSFPRCRQIWVTKIAFFGGSTVTSSGGMKNFILLSLPAWLHLPLRAPRVAFPPCDPAKNKVLCPLSMNTSSFFLLRLSLRICSHYCGICYAVVKRLEYFVSQEQMVFTTACF